MQRARLVSLFFSSGLALLVTAISYLYYSQKLTVGEFGLYGMALAVSTMASIILDGGLRTTLIKSPSAISDSTSTALVMALTACSVVVCLVFLIIYLVAAKLADVSFIKDFSFVAAFCIAYVASYPFTITPTVLLERELAYGKLGWIESSSTIIERGSPAILFSLGWGMEGFLIAVFAGRFARVVGLRIVADAPLVKPQKADFVKLRSLIVEGAWFQAAMALSAFRDNLHVIIVAPIFGKDWLGYYAWAYQIATLCSQLFVQIASRVSVPLLAAKKDFSDKWQGSLYYMRVLGSIAIPILALGGVILPYVNSWVFDGKWSLALELIPFIFLRMCFGVLTSPLGSLLLVEQGARKYCMSNLWWSFAELVGSIIAIMVFKEYGLAFSQALVVFVGIAFIMKGLMLDDVVNKISEILHAVYCRPVVAFSGLGVVSYIAISIVYADISNWNGQNMNATFVALVLILSGCGLEIFRAVRPGVVK